MSLANTDSEQCEDEVYDPDQEQRERVAGMGAWGISLAFHGIAIAILILVVVAAPWETEKAPVQPVAIQVPEVRDPPDEKKLDPEDVDPTEEIVPEVVSPDFDMEVSLEVSDISPEPVENSEQGDPDDVATMEMSTNASVAMIGMGASAPGKRGSLHGGFSMKQRLGKKMGKHGRRVFGSFERALSWFARHQSPNGQWDVDGYAMNCTKGPKCEPGIEHADEAGDIAATSYALYCFLGAGYDHRVPNKYRKVVASGIDWLLNTQKADGMFGERNYEHPIATMVLAEAYAMTNDERLRVPVQQAVDRILARQTVSSEGYLLGWDYVKNNPKRQDSSVTGWNVMALKSSKAAGFAVGKGLEGSRRWLEGAWLAVNPDHAQLGSGEGSKFPYTWNTLTGETKHDSRMSMGALCAAFLGYRSGDVLLETLVNEIMSEQMPAAYPTNTYYLYYNMMAVFQVGGERWATWNNQVTPMLIDAQRRSDDCFDGSWDFEGTEFHGHKIGRLVSTAYVCLSLQVAMRAHTIDERASMVF